MNRKLHNSTISQVIQQNTHHETPPPPPPPLSKLHKIKSPILIKKAKWKCLVYMTPSGIPNIKKYKPKMLSTIQLNLVEDDPIGKTALRDIVRALQGNKRSSSLIIKHEGDWTYHDNTEIDRLFTATNRWKSLKFFYNDQAFTSRTQEMQNLTRLRRCKDLSNLEIMLNCSEENKNIILQRLSNQLKGLSQLKSLSLDISNCDRPDLTGLRDEHFDENVTLLAFKFPPSLSSLNLTFGGGYLQNEPFLRFAETIHNCSALEHLHLYIGRLYHNIEPVTEKAWSHLFEKTQNLKTFTLEAYWYSLLSNQGAQEFFQGLQHLKQLTTLNFYFTLSSAKGLPEMFLHDLFRHLAFLPSLISLNLDLNFQFTKHLSFQNVFSHLQSLTSLQQLRLSCSYCHQIDDRFLQCFASVLKHLQSLKKLQLLLANSGISDAGIVFLAESLKELPHIQDLSLDFHNCSHLNVKSLEVLSDGIAHLNPTSLTLIIGPPKTKSLLHQIISYWDDQKEFASFSSALQKFTSLTTLALNLSAFDINMKEFNRFSWALKHLKGLTSLSLELPQFGSENNFEGFTNFGLILKDFLKLNLLHITTSKRAKLRDQEIMLFFLSVKECRFLESLRLRFELCQLTGECLQHVLSGIKSLFALENLSLSFGGGPISSREEMSKLLEGLSTLKNLEKFEMS